MSYWTGLSEEKQQQYLEELKKPAVTDTDVNPYKIVKCHHCNEIVAMKLIHDPLSNSSYLVYAGVCINGHWSQDIPGTPYDLKEPPRCPECNSIMQYKLDGAVFVCIQPHAKSEEKVSA